MFERVIAQTIQKITAETVQERSLIPLLDEGSLGAACACLAAHTAPGGLVLTGFGLDPAHLPGDFPVTPLAEVDAAMAAAGLTPGARWSTWTGEPFDDGGYVVATYRRPT